MLSKNDYISHKCKTRKKRITGEHTQQLYLVVKKLYLVYFPLIESEPFCFKIEKSVLITTSSDPEHNFPRFKKLQTFCQIVKFSIILF